MSMYRYNALIPIFLLVSESYYLRMRFGPLLELLQDHDIQYQLIPAPSSLLLLVHNSLENTQSSTHLVWSGERRNWDGEGLGNNTPFLKILDACALVLISRFDKKLAFDRVVS